MILSPVDQNSNFWIELNVFQMELFTNLKGFPADSEDFAVILTAEKSSK